MNHQSKLPFPRASESPQTAKTSFEIYRKLQNTAKKSNFELRKKNDPAYDQKKNLVMTFALLAPYQILEVCLWQGKSESDIHGTYFFQKSAFFFKKLSEITLEILAPTVTYFKKNTFGATIQNHNRFRFLHTSLFRQIPGTKGVGGVGWGVGGSPRRFCGLRPKYRDFGGLSEIWSRILAV